MANNSTVYVARAEGTHLYKVGLTGGDPARRLQSLQTGCPYQLVLFGRVPRAGVEVERKLHGQLRPFAREGEWFEVPDEAILRRLLADAEGYPEPPTGLPMRPVHYELLGDWHLWIEPDELAEGEYFGVAQNLQTGGVRTRGGSSVRSVRRALLP